MFEHLPSDIKRVIYKYLRVRDILYIQHIYKESLYTTSQLRLAYKYEDCEGFTSHHAFYTSYNLKNQKFQTKIEFRNQECPAFTISSGNVYSTRGAREEAMRLFGNSTRKVRQHRSGVNIMNYYKTIL